MVHSNLRFLLERNDLSSGLRAEKERLANRNVARTEALQSIFSLVFGCLKNIRFFIGDGKQVFKSDYEVVDNTHFRLLSNNVRKMQENAIFFTPAKDVKIRFDWCKGTGKTFFANA